MLTPASSNLLVYTISTVVDSVVLQHLYDGAGAEVTFAAFAMVATVPGAGEPTVPQVWTGTLPDCVPLAANGQGWAAQWLVTLEGDTYTDLEYLTVGYDNGALCSLADLRTVLVNVGEDKNGLLTTIIAQVSASLRAQFALPTVPQVTEGRWALVDGSTVFVGECFAATGVVDAVSGTPLIYVETPGTRPGDPLRWLTLHDSLTGAVIVTGTFGYDEMPADVVKAAAAIAAGDFKRMTGAADEDWRSAKEAHAYLASVYGHG